MAMGRLAEKLSGTLDFTWTWNGKQQPAVKSAKAVFEKAMLNDTLPAISDNIRMDIRYADMNGTPISVDDIRQGTDFIAIASISNISGTSDYTNLALTHIIPSGWEIYNERMLVADTVRLQATYAGNFILPAVQCEAMYDATIQARSKAGRTTVSR